MERLAKREEAVRGPQGLPNKGQVQSQTSVRGTGGTAFPAESRQSPRSQSSQVAVPRFKVCLFPRHLKTPTRPRQLQKHDVMKQWVVLTAKEMTGNKPKISLR